MSTVATRRAQSRWMNWRPKERISAECPEREASEPSKHGSVGFEGACSGDLAKIGFLERELTSAFAVLNRAGVRFMRLDGTDAIGVWSDLDGRDIRKALHTGGLSSLPVLYLDGAGVPMWLKLRRVEGEPVPLSVLAEMERHRAEPWETRDRLLNAGRSGAARTAQGRGV